MGEGEQEASKGNVRGERVGEAETECGTRAAEAGGTLRIERARARRERGGGLSLVAVSPRAANVPHRCRRGRKL